ncbi:MAG TPA: DUF1345 domain-containing protein [Rhizomicrobium sp.]|nr:DUF1345 domain-containing protein [Rhizomicrobium sp.]
MTGFARSHLAHHGRFYACAVLGALVFALTGSLDAPVRLLAGGDSFFLSYIAVMAVVALRITPRALDKKADVEDEGIAIVVLASLVMIGFCCFAIVTLLHQKQAVDPFAIVLAVVGAPLGWAMLHMMMAFHYAYLFYSEPGKAAGSGLEFPGKTPEPGAAEFLYFSFVVGMTAQVSDVQVTSTRIRRTVLGHGIVSFFFNTVLIAMAVNAVVAVAA